MSVLCWRVQQKRYQPDRHISIYIYIYICIYNCATGPIPQATSWFSLSCSHIKYYRIPGRPSNTFSSDEEGVVFFIHCYYSFIRFDRPSLCVPSTMQRSANANDFWFFSSLLLLLLLSFLGGEHLLLPPSPASNAADHKKNIDIDEYYRWYKVQSTSNVDSLILPLYLLCV